LYDYGVFDGAKSVLNLRW